MWSFDIFTRAFTYLAGTRSNNVYTTSPTTPSTREGTFYFTLPNYPTKLFFIGGYMNSRADQLGDIWEFDVLSKTFTPLHNWTTISDTSNIFTGPTTRPGGTSYGYALTIDGDTAFLGFTLKPTSDADTNRCWLYHRPSNRFMFIGANSGCA
jgi:hypothetical protein